MEWVNLAADFLSLPDNFFQLGCLLGAIGAGGLLLASWLFRVPVCLTAVIGALKSGQRQCENDIGYLDRARGKPLF